MVPFAGWAMPVLYQDSLMESTKHCRENASIFDVSHMCGATFKVLPLIQTLGSFSATGTHKAKRSQDLAVVARRGCPHAGP